MKPFSQFSDDDLGALLRRAVELPDAPESLVQRALKLWPGAQGTSLTALARQAIQHIVASLTFDSWAAPALPGGLRSAGSETRQLLFTAEGRDIDVRVTPTA